MGGPAQIPPHSRGRWDGVGGARRMERVWLGGIPPRDLRCTLKVGYALISGAQTSQRASLGDNLHFPKPASASGHSLAKELEVRK